MPAPWHTRTSGRSRGSTARCGTNEQPCALARHKGRGAKTRRRPAPARKRIPGEPVDFRPFGLMRALRQHAGPAWSESCQARPRLPVARARRMVRALSGPGLGPFLHHRRWRRCAARSGRVPEDGTGRAGTTPSTGGRGSRCKQTWLQHYWHFVFNPKDSESRLEILFQFTMGLCRF